MLPANPTCRMASWHNPIDTESLLSYPGIRDVANPPSVQPQNLREQIEAAGASGAGAALSGRGLLGGLSSLWDAAKTAVQGAVSGAAGDVGGDVGEAVGGTPGRVAGTLTGGIAGARMAPGGGGPAALLPSTMDAETTALAQRAKDLGIDVGVGAASDSPVIKYLDSVMRRLPFTGYGKYDEANQQAFAKAVTNTFGEDAPKVTPTVIDNAYNRIGQVFSNIGGVVIT